MFICLYPLYVKKEGSLKHFIYYFLKIYLKSQRFTYLFKKEKEERVSIGTGGAAQTLLWFTSVIPEGENSTLGIPQEERKQKSIQRLTHECIQRLYS